jgi:HEAT repeat protein
VNYQFYKSYFLAISLPAFAVMMTGRAMAQSPQPQPIFDQCKSLTAGRIETVSRAIALLKDKDSKVRVQAAQQLSESCDQRVVEPLTELLRDEDPVIRVAAVEALGRVGDPESIQPLNDLLNDKDWRVRLALVSSLSSYKTFSARNPVLNVIANPSSIEITDVDDMRVRCAAILTLNQLPDVSYSRKALLFLYTFLQSKHSPIRHLAEQTMIALKNTRNGSIELIALVKQSNNPELRRWSAEWIGKLGIERGREILQEVAQKDPDARVKQEAASALKALTQ